ncbi:MAG: hypothetical protein HGA31_01325 [Candidatus Moranbacteria bacterium]|nr:hypothetical protein [Candidatus Moranbacteria bacterium]
MSINDALKEELTTKLQTAKARLEGELSRFARPTEVPGEYETRFEDIGTDMDDNATEVEQYADNVALEDNLENQLAGVTEALERMEAGTYGICSVCGKDIEEGRLRAYLSATECMEHAK